MKKFGFAFFVLFLTYICFTSFALAAPAISVSPSKVIPGGAVVVSYSDAPGNASDWIGVFRLDASNREHMGYQYLGGSRSGTLTFNMPWEL